MDALTVHHFGPDPSTVGGIATVIRLLAEHRIGGDRVCSHPTWRPQAPIVSARLTASSAKALWQLPAGRVAHIHLSERGSFLREGALVALARKRGLVTVVTIHGASFLPFEARHPRLVSAVLRRAHLVTCLEEGALEIIRRSAPAAHCEIVPNPVLIDDDASPADETDELVVFAGEIGLRKGADILHRAWPLVAQRRPHARCLMVGPLDAFASPEAERLEVRPPVDPVEAKRILRSARVIALPTRAEGMPMVLTEAMSLGRPFVSTPVGGIPELAAAGGILVPVDDEVELANRLTELLADPSLARTIGERGRRFCMQTRSVEILDGRLRRLYAAASGSYAAASGSLCSTPN
jgi:glycosyltransferase involved in cell wall biosynthesis